MHRFLKPLIVVLCLSFVAYIGYKKTRRHEVRVTNAKRSAIATADIKPLFADVHYGPDSHQVLDFYKAESKTPTPLMFFIHGGGWVAGHKTEVIGIKDVYLEGISIVSIDLRPIQDALAAKVNPPIEWPMHDAARALQFVRSKAAEWNIDKDHICACGSSSGACTSLWLALHKDMAKPHSTDPVARESTRVWCASVRMAQSSLDPAELVSWAPNSTYSGHAFGFFPNPQDLKTRDDDFAGFLAHREDLLPWIKEYSPIAHVTSDDPPIYIWFRDVPQPAGKRQHDPTHTAVNGLKLQEKCKEVGVPCEIWYPQAPDAPHDTAQAYLIDKVRALRSN